MRIRKYGVHEGDVVQLACLRKNSAPENIACQGRGASSTFNSLPAIILSFPQAIGVHRGMYLEQRHLWMS